MIGTREWISKVEEIIKKAEVDSNNRHLQYFETMLRQGKKNSQIISYIWLNEDKVTAQKLDGYFKRSRHEKGKDELKKLLFAKKSGTGCDTEESEESEEYELLRKVFDEESLPIFDEDDEKWFEIRVVTDTFEGNISDPGPSNNRILTVTIPYPPRPQIYDDYDDCKCEVIPTNEFTTIKESQLREWLKQKPENEPYFYKDNPYIPATSS